MRREESADYIEMQEPCILRPQVTTLYSNLPLSRKLSGINYHLSPIETGIKGLDQEKVQQEKTQVRKEFFLKPYGRNGETVFSKLLSTVRYHQNKNTAQLTAVQNTLASLFACLDPVPFQALIQIVPHLIETVDHPQDEIHAFFKGLFFCLLEKLKEKDKIALIKNLIQVRFTYKRHVICSAGDYSYPVEWDERVSILQLLIAGFKSFGQSIVSEYAKRQLRTIFCQIFALCDTAETYYEMLAFFNSVSVSVSDDSQQSYLKEVEMAVVTLLDCMRYISVAITPDENGEVHYNDQKKIDAIISLLSQSSIRKHFVYYLENENILVLKSTMNAENFSLFKAVLKRDFQNYQHRYEREKLRLKLEESSADSAVQAAKTDDERIAATLKSTEVKKLLEKLDKVVDSAFSVVFSNRVAPDERSVVFSQLQERLKMHIDALNSDMKSTFSLFLNTTLKQKKLRVLDAALAALNVKGEMLATCRSLLMLKVQDLIDSMAASNNTGWNDGVTGNLVSEILYELKQVVLKLEGVAPSMLAWKKPELVLQTSAASVSAADEDSDQPLEMVDFPQVVSFPH